MKEQGREPMKVAVGQRWRGALSGRIFDVVSDDGDGSWSIRYEGEPVRPNCAVVGNEFLGYAPGFGPSPSPEGAGRVMEEQEDGNPARCLCCGGDKQHRMYICVPCSPVAVPYTEEQQVAIDSWRDGARDFPRSPAPVPASYTIPVRVDPSLRPGEWRLESPPTKPLYGRAVGEMRAQDGSPLSALQTIQSRPKPEPWVPSCDDDHWIPSVGERGTR